MSLRERLEADMKAAMKSRDTLRLETIRGVRGAMRNKEIELGESLDEDGILRVIRTLVKQRVDSIEQFQAAGRASWSRRRPPSGNCWSPTCRPPPTRRRWSGRCAAVIAELGAQGPKDMGRVMKAALEKLGRGGGRKARERGREAPADGPLKTSCRPPRGPEVVCARPFPAETVRVAGLPGGAGLLDPKAEIAALGAAYQDLIETLAMIHFAQAGAEPPPAFRERPLGERFALMQGASGGHAVEHLDPVVSAFNRGLPPPRRPAERPDPAALPA